MRLGRATVGQQGEYIAQRQYQALGFKIITTNFYNPVGRRRGEIDFIATKNRLIVFVEVKTRTTNKFAYESAVGAISFTKRRRMLLAIKWFFLTHPQFNSYQPKIDVCLVFLDKTAKYVRILSNAVEDLY